MLKDIVITVEEIEGRCEVYKKGDRIFFTGPKIDLNRSDAVCIHALPAILHYINAFRLGGGGDEFGLSRGERPGHLACVDPGPPYTNGGRAIFRLEAIQGE